MKTYSPTPGDASLTMIVRNKFVWGAPATLRSSVMVVLYRSDLPVGTVVTELRNLKALGVIGSQPGRGQMEARQLPEARQIALWTAESNQ